MGLYRSLLRTSQSWTGVPSRESRGMRLVLPDAIREQFREGASLADRQQIVDRKKHGYESLEFLRRLVTDQVRLATGAGELAPAPEMAQKASRLLSSESQEKIQKRKWGFIERLLGSR